MSTPKKTSAAEHKIITENRKARHDYEILETYEAGLVLVGSEVKSLRDSKASLVDSYAQVENGEVWLKNARIEGYGPASYQDHDPKRQRKLLLHHEEIDKIERKVDAKGLSLIPLSMYFKGARAKLTLALARGKRDYQKDETQRERTISREIARSVRSHEVNKRRQ